MLDVRKLEIGRIIVHRVHKKVKNEDFGYADYSEDLFSFGTTELATLISRIESAFSKNKRFFKLEIARFEENSFFDYASKMKKCDRRQFISLSKSIADLLAVSHKRANIPSGLLLVLDGYLHGKHFVLTIKAELQEAFTIREHDAEKIIELLNDLFLSPAKDFYKIGMIVEDENDMSFPNDSYSCYMYDDNYSTGKKDLAEYFYETFLGFTTNRNDKLTTKNFHNDLFKFIESNVKAFDDKRGLKNAVNAYYRENTTGVINPQEFAEQHFPPQLLRVFGSEVAASYPHSFVKDLTLVDRSLHRGTLKLVDDLKIEGPMSSIDNVSVSSGASFDVERLRLQIENGEIRQIITIKADDH